MNTKLCLAADLSLSLVVPVCPLVNKEDTAPSVCVRVCEGAESKASVQHPHTVPGLRTLTPTV